ncbi:biotin carboxyl carrier protein of acetyl-CoA carboxylase 1, chloroplastic-like [Zingiber officinale]|uniref:biotin carboxyl carrier protein of acetyl-CoA carboxylase 1, chloroplastic-like n=1 Tax=Zingiber officinale TaxID=94328 RepID=UPI001C4D18B6|nr:biotin carboxyl carrier protein of acetyl-CoA carboxylase 1, chloroplastic-like [Zingiber officinale]
MMVASASSIHAAPATTPQVSAAAFAASSSSRRQLASASFPLPSRPTKRLLFPDKGLAFRRDHPITAKVKLNEVVGGSANDAASPENKAEISAPKGKDVKDEQFSLPSAPMSEKATAEFMSQVINLVKLVDSRDISELQLKQNNCELIIRKKEALPRSQPAQVVMMQPPVPALSAVPQASPVTALPSPSPASPAPPMPASTPKALKTSHPPLKSPMAGTFYRSPGPGLPSFVKIGDKINKGQVLCIIEAMKLMNEIEADQAGTIVEILIEDGKPVGVEQPIFVIEP